MYCLTKVLFNSIDNSSINVRTIEVITLDGSMFDIMKINIGHFTRHIT